MKIVYGTTGYVEHLDKGENCPGCILVEIEGETCTLICNECGTNLGSGSPCQ